MSNIDKIFSKLIDHQVQAPDIWKKLDAELNNNPTNGLENNLYKASRVKVIATSSIFKAVGVVVGSLAIGVSTYLYLNNNNGDELSKPKIETINNQNKPINIFVEKNSSVYKPISIKSIDNSNAKSVDSQSQSVEEYNVNDEKELVIKNTNSSVSPINSIQTSTPTVISNNTQQNNSTQQEETKYPIQNSPKLIIPNLMTPNGDGINDLFEIKNIDQFPENSIIIFDVKGKIIYRCKGYKNNFDAKNIPQGTYFYKLEYNDLGKKQTKGGSITILRN